MRVLMMIPPLVPLSLLVVPSILGETEAKHSKHANTQGSTNAQPLQTTTWSEDRLGLQFRVKAPQQIEEGMPLKVHVEFRGKAQDLKATVQKVNLSFLDACLELSLSSAAIGEALTVRPYDPTGGLLLWEGDMRVALVDGNASTHRKTIFPLLTLRDTLSPGQYECRVTYTFPGEHKTLFSRRTEAEWRDAGFWTGTVTSGPFTLNVLKETPKMQTYCLPKRLYVEKGSMIHFRMEDADEVKLPVRNGHFLGTYYYRGNEKTCYKLTSGVPKPDDVMCIDHRVLDRNTSYRLEVFETATPPSHLWDPRVIPGAYRVLWKKTYQVKP